MLRSFFLYLSQANWARAFITRFRLAWLAASRFVAGETADDAIAAIRALNARGISATVDLLGESVTNEAEAVRAVEGYLLILNKIAANDVRSNVSIKLTQFGLDIDQDLCLRNVRRVVGKAKATHNFVRIDMEGTPHTDRTLDVFRALQQDAKFADNVGIVLQSYLYRTEKDLRVLAEAGTRVRLCKGAYNEPPDKAFPRKADVDANYVKLMRLLLDRAQTAPPADGSGRVPPLPALATHDEKMIATAKAYTAEKHIPREYFEFQMLYGIRRDLQEQLVREGYAVRVYVPYGTSWYPYFMRRLAERPANVWFFVSNFFRR
jgi:proline dehydrogenase